MKKDQLIHILQDSREKNPWTFENYPAVVHVGTLQQGDYCPVGGYGPVVERKSMEDGVGSLIHGRAALERELKRLAANHSRSAVLIEASWHDLAHHKYRSKAKPHSVLQTMISWWVKYGVPFIPCGDRAGAEYFAYWAIQKHIRNAEISYKQAMKGQA